jgi:hypothetical protein
MHNVGA